MKLSAQDSRETQTLASRCLPGLIIRQSHFCGRGSDPGRHCASLQHSL